MLSVLIHLIGERKPKNMVGTNVVIKYLHVLTLISDNASEVQKLQQAIKLEELKIQLLEKQKHRQQLELDP